MNLTPLQNLLPEWEFSVGRHGGITFIERDANEYKEPFTTLEERDSAYLDWLLERALLKREGACCVTTSSCNNEDCSLVTHTAQVALFEDEAIKEWGHTTKLAALLEVIERLPGLGGDEK